MAKAGLTSRLAELEEGQPMPKDTGEHNTTVAYVREVGGRAYFEVPVSGPTVTPGSRVRKIDAVRIEGLADGECLDFDHDSFIADLHEARVRGLEVELIEAKNLLAGTGKSIAEIGFELGYNEKSYFSKVFKKKSGQTPSEFREEMQKLIS